MFFFLQCIEPRNDLHCLCLHIVYSVLSIAQQNNFHTLTCLDKASQFPGLHTNIPGTFPLPPKISAPVQIIVHCQSPCLSFLSLTRCSEYQVTLHAGISLQLGYVLEGGSVPLAGCLRQTQSLSLCARMLDGDHTVHRWAEGSFCL